MPKIHGNEILEILRTKYERVPDLQFAGKDSIQVGDILFATGNGANSQPEILRVLEIDLSKTYFMVAKIEPATCPPCNNANRECAHPFCCWDGSVLLTKILGESS